MTEKYERILTHPHHTSDTRRRMSAAERAAQFAPYAALSGFDKEVSEEARITVSKNSLDEDEIARLDLMLRRLSAERAAAVARITYFEVDPFKSGGNYRVKQGRISDVDPYSGSIIFTDGYTVSIDMITDIEIL